MAVTKPLEKLGAFYLGQEYDLAAGERRGPIIQYDARDLTTHALCLGMTGSGKTGLCIDLLEEAALDQVPAIIIDPKGDITNRLLTFPELRPEDFQPWINADDARRKGKTPEEHAAATAQLWKKGLADWGQGPQRVGALKDSVDLRIYTPGSTAGLPVSVLSSLAAPTVASDEDLHDQVRGTVSAVLGFVGVDADPLQSREHILLSNVLEHYWRQGKDLDLGTLIQSIQNPPIRKLGVFDLDTFFPSKDRFELAMRLNSIMAAPSFASWLQGDPLDVAQLLHSSGGKPRHSIFYIAHLSEAERMFFVTLLLEQVISWMRKQSGTTSLRALVYMDEIFGYFPPVANPPSKQPLLTLLKQARAFGVGMVLATQNPVDLDYKGLTNIGTWFIGKLQAERDKMRVLEGLETAAQEAGQSWSRADIDRILSSLDPRVFLLHNVHDERPRLMHTRWAMSYLRGPLTRDQIRTLMDGQRDEDSAAQPAQPAGEEVKVPAVRDGYSVAPPTLPPALPQAFLPVEVRPSAALDQVAAEVGAVREESPALVYEPGLLTLGQVSFVDARRGVHEKREVGRLARERDLGRIVRWGELPAAAFEDGRIGDEPEEDEAWYAAVPKKLGTARQIKSYEKDYADHLYREERFEIYRHEKLKLYGEPEEGERDFRARVQLAAREKRDAEVEKLQGRFEKKIDAVQDRLEREQLELEEDEDRYSARKREEVVSAGERILGFFFGRRRSTGLSSTATKRRMTTKAKADVKQTKAKIKQIEDDIKALEREAAREVEAITSKWEQVQDGFETYPIKPRRADVDVQLCALAWLPFWEVAYEDAGGRSGTRRVPAWGGGRGVG